MKLGAQEFKGYAWCFFYKGEKNIQSRILKTWTEKLIANFSKAFVKGKEEPKTKGRRKML